MKEIRLLFICTVLLISSNIFSQDEGSRIQNLEDQLKIINSRIEAETRSNATINANLVRFRETNIKQTVAFLNRLNSDIAFQNQIQATNTYLSYVVEINNANKDLLGFSLQSKISEYLGPIKSELGKTRGGFFDNLVKKLIEIPVVGNIVKTAGTIIESPIFQTISSVLPVSSVLSSVSTFVSSGVFAADEKKLDTAVVSTFQRKLSSIFGIYSNLDNINSNFNSEQINLQIKTQSMRSKFHSILIDLTKRLYRIENIDSKLNDYQILDNYFNGDKLNVQIQRIKDENTDISALVIDSRFQYSAEGKSILEGMYQDYMKITIEYKNSYVNLNSSLTSLLSTNGDLNSMLNDNEKKTRDKTVSTLADKYKPIAEGDFFNGEITSLKVELDAIRMF